MRDPGNVGTLIRLADWYGLAGVVLLAKPAPTPGRRKRWWPPWARLPGYPSGSATCPSGWARLPAGLPVYGADLHGDNVHRLTLQPSGVLIMGSESHGLTPPVEACLTQRLHIPGRGQAESLNVAVSAAILLDNFFRNL